MPSTELYCPVCANDVTFISVWQDPQSDRIRIFCDDCSQRPDYRSLPKEQRQIMNLEGFRKFASARQLRHAHDHERQREAGEPRPNGSQ